LPRPAFTSIGTCANEFLMQLIEAIKRRSTVYDVTYLLLETVLEEERHRAIQMFLHARQIVPFVGVDLLLEQRAAMGERLRQHHALEQMHVIVGRSVNL
jgi:hypothetical protein